MNTRVLRESLRSTGRWGALVWLCCAVAQTGCQSRSTEPQLAAAASRLTETTGESEMTTWTCTGTGSSCPWGDSLSNHALAWPASAEPIATRLGYETSPAVYLPAASANGLTISIEFGSADLFAGEPFASSHSFVATVSAGDSFRVSGLDDGEVLSVQSADSFGYRLTPSDPSDTPDAGVPEPDAGDPGPDAGPAPDAGPGTTVGGTASQAVTWACTGTPCPWGTSPTGQALVWPAESRAITARLGYSVSTGIYLPAGNANGATISIDSGEAGVYAGLPGDASHRVIANLEAGDTVHITGLAGREVLSVQSDEEFTYHATLPPPGAPGDDPEGPAPEVIQSQLALWRCNTPTCVGADWTGAIITWPSWAAYQSNARVGDVSRSVFSTDGTPLFTYMGAWAEGCEVTAESGTVLIIEWQRGTNTWRETWLYPRQTHVIHLTSPENGAMIESYDGSPGFGVSLKNCTPQPLVP